MGLISNGISGDVDASYFMDQMPGDIIAFFGCIVNDHEKISIHGNTCQFSLDGEPPDDEGNDVVVNWPFR